MSAPKRRRTTMNLLNYIDEIFKCSICLDNYKEPRMCFHCSKLFCSKCINNWIEQKSPNGKCPNCKGCLKEKLVTIRWQGDIQNLHPVIKQEISNGTQDCQLHNKKIR